jgi:hypothetical protein
VQPCEYWLILAKGPAVGSLRLTSELASAGDDDDEDDDDENGEAVRYAASALAL